MHFSDPEHTSTFIVDNGSLRPESVSSLRAIAARLSERLGFVVEPVSLLHSSAIPPEKLEGRRAPILEPELRARCAAGGRRFRVLPLFFGASGAIADYIPERVSRMREIWPDLRVDIARPVIDVGEDDTRIAGAIAERVRETISNAGIGASPDVVLVDHGSPKVEVARVRDHVARQLASALASEAASVTAASMERREGDAYAFNEPLLERALESLAERGVRGEVVVALMFFSPGRHAGQGGDIAEICERAVERFPGLRVHVADVIGAHPALVDVLASRWRELVAGEAGTQTEG